MKKSMSRPMVKGTLMETALETMSRPMAIPSGLRSGFARARILRKEEALLVVSCASAGRNRLHSDFFSEFEEDNSFDGGFEVAGVELDGDGDEERRGDEEK